MPKLAADRAAKEQVKEVVLAENRFEIASENVENDDAGEEVPRIAEKQRRGHELPRICSMQAAIAQRQKFAHKLGLVCVQKKLSDERNNA